MNILHLILFEAITLIIYFDLTTATTFPTGCSFTDGKCYYIVELGHKGQCDKKGVEENGAGKCKRCDKIEKDLNDHKVVTMEQLVQMKNQIIESNQHRGETDTAINTLKHEIKTTKTRIGETDGQVLNISSRITNIEKQVKDVVDINKSLKVRLERVEDRLRISREEIQEKEEEIRRSKEENERLEKSGETKEIKWSSLKEGYEMTIRNLTSILGSTRDKLGLTASGLQQCYEAINVTKPIDEIVIPDNSSVKTFVFNFESSTDGNLTKSGGKAEFTLKQGSTSYSRTGPDADHTIGNNRGHYLYIDTVKEALKSDRSRIRHARVETPTMPSSPYGYCLKFWYHMYGSDQRNLNVYFKVNNGMGYPQWSMKENQGNEWKYAELDISTEYSRTPFEIVFEGSTTAYRYRYSSNNYRMSDLYSQLAIDDIYVTNRPCKDIQRCPSGSVPATDGSGSCFIFVPSAMIWEDAVLRCRSYGPKAHLVQVNSAEKHDFLVNVTRHNKALAFASSAGWYTSGNDEDIWGNWLWTNTPSRDRLTWTNWQKGQPNNVADAQHCMLMEYPENSYAWGDVECFSRHPFICEIMK